MTQMMQPGDLCLVTGVSGHLASRIAKDLLEGGFRVRGTVRNLKDSDKVRTMRSLLPGIDLVEVDLRSPVGWPEAAEECRWIFRVASPQGVSSETDRTGAAVRGTEHLMRAALGAASVEKIVLTSSEAAVAYGHPRSKQRFDEDDWTNPKGPAGANDYFRSKTLAEKLAWDLVSDPTLNSNGIALSTINPGLILGPTLVPWGRFSLEMLKTIAESGMPLIPDMVTHIVDVRDCARMHIALMGIPPPTVIGISHSASRPRWSRSLERSATTMRISASYPGPLWHRTP